MNKNKLILFVGLPRSGKSTSAKLLDFPIVNPDSIRLALHGQRFQSEAEPFVWAIAYLMVDALFKAGHNSVIVDATNITQKRRAPWIEKFRDDCDIEFIVEDAPMEICIERARAIGDTEIIPIIESMAERAEWPEGKTLNDIARRY